METGLTFYIAPPYTASTSVIPGTRSLNGTLGTSRTLEDPPDYTYTEHLTSTTTEIGAPSLYREIMGISRGVEMDRRRDISLPSFSFVQESTVADNTSLEKGESVMQVETQSSRQGPVRRAEDGGIRIAGGPPGRQVHDWGGSHRESEVASSTCSTLPPAYNSDIS